jgi:hypothetical protein
MGDTDEPVVEAVEFEYESDEDTPTDLGEVTEGELTDEEVPA